MHWHLIPLPPGVSYEDQQAAALRPEQGWLEIPASTQTALSAALATRIVENLQAAP